MFKLRHYVFRYWYLFLLGIICIFGQAAAELALPGYMSTIVTNGIQSGGYTSSVVEAYGPQSFESLLAAANQRDRQIMLSSYQYYDQLDETLSHRYPLTDALYILNERYDDSLEDALNRALMTRSLLPESYTSEELAEIRKEAVNQIREMGSASLKITIGTLVREDQEALGFSTASKQNQYILKMGLVMLFLAFLGAAVSFIGAAFASLLGTKVARDIRHDLFTKIESFSEEEMQHFSTASLITRSTNDITQVQILIIVFVRMICFAPVLGLGALIKAVTTSLELTWIIMIALVLIVGLMIFTMVFAMPKFKIVQELIDKLNLAMRENLSGMLVIRAFGNESYARKRFEQRNSDLMAVNLFVNRLMVVLSPMMTLIMNGVSLAIVYVGARQVDLGTIAIGEMMAFLQYAMMIIMGFLMIGMMAVMFPRAEISAMRINEVLTTEVSIKDPSNPETFTRRQGEIIFDHVSFTYPEASEHALYDISFTAKPGEMTALIGSTGSGKTTLINLIPRFYDVTEGHVYVNGVDVRHVKTNDLRNSIGLVPQHSHLFSGTIRSNVLYGAQDETMLTEALRIAQAQGFVEKLPGGVNAPIAQGGSNVSGGQKQRLAIARAIAKQPDILIFDDSFSALDFKTDAALRKELMSLCQKTSTTIILVGQRIASIMHAANIIVLNEGKIVGQGTHKDLLETCEVYQEIAYSQLSTEELVYE